MNAPDGIEPMIGYRAFIADPNDTRLYPTAGYGDGWDPGPNQAMCYATERHLPVVAYRNGPDGVEKVETYTHGLIPSERCTCGFWTLNSPTAVAERFLKRPKFNIFSAFTGACFVVGRVKTWGRVVVGENGTRSEYAEITALLSGNADALTNPEHLDKIAAAYGVPVEACRELDKPEDVEKQADLIHKAILYGGGPDVYGLITSDKVEALPLRWAHTDSDSVSGSIYPPATVESFMPPKTSRVWGWLKRDAS